MGPLDDDSRAEVDRALASWRQGDCVLGGGWFVFGTCIERPLTAEGAAAAAAGAELAEVEVVGFMVATQTCDLVRRCRDRAFVEVCPLVEVDGGILGEIKRGRRPSYAFVPELAERRWVADLERVMTVEKGVVAGWSRVPGWSTDEEARRLGMALARKRARMAFPDDFVALANPLQSRLGEKHDKKSGEGEALRALREIRVRAEPSWSAERVTLMFWFIRGDTDIVAGRDLSDWLARWLELVPAGGRFSVVDGVVQTLDDMSAREYVESDPLDLDHLSGRKG